MEDIDNTTEQPIDLVNDPAIEETVDETQEVIPEPEPDHTWDNWYTDDTTPVDVVYVKDDAFFHTSQILNPSTNFVSNEIIGYQTGAWYLLSDEQRAFHEANPTASAMEVISMKLNEPEVIPEPVRTIEQAISEKLAAIDAYDNSEAVNSFFVNGYPTWIDAATRSTYLTSIQMAAIRKKETIVIPILGMYPELPLDHATGMLAQIQGQADDSAIMTLKHKDAVKAFTTKEGVTVEEVDSYDNTTGYPEKASFTIQI